MTAHAHEDAQRLSFEALAGLLARIFRRHGVSPAHADLLALNCAACERDGSLSHGIFRIPGYVSSLKSGWVDGAAVPAVEETGGSFIRIDARNGFAQPALEAGRRMAVETARRNGVALVAIRRSHHFSALWPDVEPFADQGLVALSVVNSFACVVPHGGHSPVFGTNPVAFAAPTLGPAPLVFDQASSAIANGDVQIAAREGRLLDPGTGVDRNGRPTRDPSAVLDGGALLPFGGHKGSSIALMVEILAAALTGGYFSSEFDWGPYEGAQTPKTGQLLILIDPERGGNAVFRSRVSRLIDHVREAGQERLPGDRRREARARAEAMGIPIGRRDREMLEGYA